MPPQVKHNKTVYILGAGFSSPAGGPSQDKILHGIAKLAQDPDPELAKQATQLLAFLKEVLKVSTEKLTNASLEDIYTPIDRCLADRVSLRGKSQNEVERKRADLDHLISVVIQRSFQRQYLETEYVQRFATRLVNMAAKRGELAQTPGCESEAKRYDPFSIISLNWDILLDNALDTALKAKDAVHGTGHYDAFGVVDYCCYVSSFEEGDNRIRSGLWSLGAKGYNVKLLKLHGSMNWLQCPNCQRLFTSFNEKLVVSRKIGTHCRHCNDHQIRAKLRGTLVMPTFLKDFSNFQLKLVWQNAAVELMEATNLVFIGYSLPHADFEFRQLLTRMVRRSAPIHVVLYEDAKDRARYREEVARYKQFFTGHRLTFDPEGVIEYVRKISAVECPGSA
ncbi:MAG: hypothetical protein KF688_18490 [Pirellulales bacterium]|nr:hypothetical protein [Pirellulales bacterium]